MFAQRLKSHTILVVMVSTIWSSAYALDTDYASVLANTKEPRSEVITPEQVEAALVDTSGISLPSVFQTWTLKLSSAKSLCEPDVVAALVDSYDSKPSQKVLESSLILFRHYNQIDDVVLLPLLNYVPSHAELSKIKGAENCLTEQWLKFRNKVRKDRGYKYRHHHLKKALKEATHLSSLEKEAFWILFKHRWAKTTLTFQSVVDLKKSFYNPDAKPLDFQKTPEWVVDKKRRIRLYERFNDFQIQYLSDILEKLHARMWADFKLLIDYPESSSYEDETLNISKNAQYEHAGLLLCNELAKLQNSRNFNGAVSFEELVSSSFESGLIPIDEIAASLKIEHVWNAPLTKKEKWLKRISRFGSPLLMLIPPPYNYTATLTMGFLQSMFKDKKVEGPKGCLWYL